MEVQNIIFNIENKLLKKVTSYVIVKYITSYLFVIGGVYMKEIYNNMSQKAYIYGAIYSLSNRLQALGDKIDPEISTKQWFVLAAVSKFNDKVPNIGDIANMLGTSRQNVKKIAKILEEKGYLKLTKGKKDSRNIELVLTESCFEYFRSRENQEEEYINQLFSGIDDNMLDLLYNSMIKLVENTDRMEDSE